MNKNVRRCLGLGIAALLLFGAFVSDKGIKVQAVADSYMEDLEQKRQDALEKIDDIKADITEVQNKISGLEKSKSNLQSYINDLDEQAAALTGQIQDMENQIAQKQEEIRQQEEELLQAQETADTQYENMKIRIQYMYENGMTSYFEELLTSQSISDMLNKMDYIAQIAQYDRDMMDAYIATTELIAAYKAQLEAEEEELQILHSGLEEQKAAVELLIETKSAEIARYQSQINEANADAKDYASQLAAQEKALNDAEEAIAIAAAAAGNDGHGDGGASGFLWPCPSSKRITSYFGPRPQPTPGASTDHKGIDIGASSGSAIIASASGVVTTATYSKSAGNYIVISHGGGMSTVYMHCSALYVSVGERVTMGETIAAVGSTGYSTGPHLHFGIIKNGTYVNPLNYVK